MILSYSTCRKNIDSLNHNLCAVAVLFLFLFQIQTLQILISIDCMTNVYWQVHREPFNVLDLFGSVTLLAIGQCASVCNETPGCETIQWNASIKECRLYGHIYALTRIDLTTPDVVLFTRYAHVIYTEGDPKTPKV